MTKIKLWLILGLIGAVAVGAIGYLVLLSPQTASAAKANTKAATVESSNDSLALQIARLKSDKAKLPDVQNRIDEIDARIPSTPELPSYIRWLSGVASTTHVQLLSISPSTPGPIAATAPTAPVAAAPGGTATASAAPVAPAAPAASALTGINLSYKIVGNYFAVQAFLKQLENSPRATVVSSIQLAPGGLSSAGPAAGAAGTPVAGPPAWQTLSAQISATIFMSSTPAATGNVAAPATTASGAAATAPASAAPSAGTNN